MNKLLLVLLASALPSVVHATPEVWSSPGYRTVAIFSAQMSPGFLDANGFVNDLQLTDPEGREQADTFDWLETRSTCRRAYIHTDIIQYNNEGPARIALPIQICAPKSLMERAISCSTNNPLIDLKILTFSIFQLDRDEMELSENQKVSYSLRQILSGCESREEKEESIEHVPHQLLKGIFATDEQSLDQGSKISIHIHYDPPELLRTTGVHFSIGDQVRLLKGF